jgi:hypothetical protein
VIGETENADAELSQSRASASIVVDRIRLGVLTAVEFDGCGGCVAEEVEDVSFDGDLAAELESTELAVAEKGPEFLLRFGGLAAHVAREAAETGVGVAAGGHRVILARSQAGVQGSATGVTGWTGEDPHPNPLPQAASVYARMRFLALAGEGENALRSRGLLSFFVQRAEDLVYSGLRFFGLGGAEVAEDAGGYGAHAGEFILGFLSGGPVVGV